MVPGVGAGGGEQIGEAGKGKRRQLACQAPTLACRVRGEPWVLLGVHLLLVGGVSPAGCRGVSRR